MLVLCSFWYHFKGHMRTVAHQWVERNATMRLEKKHGKSVYVMIC